MITKEFEGEKRIFLRALESFKRKGSDYAGVFGEVLKRFNGYGLFNNNCGGWAKYIVEGSGGNWPPIARLYNGGVAVGGPLEYPTKIIDAFVRGVYFSNYDNSELYDEYLLNINGIEEFNNGIVLFRIPF